MAWPLSLFAAADHGGTASASPVTPPATPASPVSPVHDLLRHFEVSGPTLPPSSRVGDPKLKQKEGQPIRLWQFWKYGAFAAVKATDVLAALVSHTIRGPPKKSWGIEMTLITCMMRDLTRHTHLADIAFIRMFMGIGGLAPVPSDALVTPVTFRVQKRALRGILADFDALEDGSRELSGEWVVGKRTWQRLQREWQHCRRLKQKLGSDTTAAEAIHQPKRKERVILYLHGGAYYVSTPATHRLVTIPLSKHLDARLFSLDYRLAPETRFPGSLHDAVSAYFRLVEDLHISPENIIIAGDSAGGGLSLALMLYLRDNDYPMPGGAILMSPWVDLTMSCDSWDSNAKYDIIPMPEPGDHLNPIACYLGEHMEKYLTHPYASPLFGDLRGLPPLLIQGGDAEVLRDEVTLLAHKATAAGVTVRHELYEDMVHVFQAFPFLDQARQAFVSAQQFVREVLSVREDDTELGLQLAAEESLEHEIDAAETRVVRGDGTQSSANKNDIRVHSLERREASTNASIGDNGDDDDDYGDDVVRIITVDADAEKDEKDLETDTEAESTEDEPSWVKPAPKTRSWRSATTTPELGNHLPEKIRIEHTRHDTARSLPTSRRRASSAAGSTWSPLTAFTSLTAQPHSHSPTLHAHGSTLRRVQSRPHLPRKSEHSQYLQPHPPSKEYRLPLTSASLESAPRPHIRRSHSSHPDITSLCAEWANHGPANKTLTYKPAGSSSSSTGGHERGSAASDGTATTGSSRRRKLSWSVVEAKQPVDGP